MQSNYGVFNRLRCTRQKDEAHTYLYAEVAQASLGLWSDLVLFAGDKQLADLSETSYWAKLRSDCNEQRQAAAQ